MKYRTYLQRIVHTNTVHTHTQNKNYKEIERIPHNVTPLTTSTDSIKPLDNNTIHRNRPVLVKYVCQTSDCERVTVWINIPYTEKHMVCPYCNTRNMKKQ